VVVATDSTEIKEAVEAHGLEAVMTRGDHESGSDRIYEALQLIDPNKEFDAVINVQGDLPTIDPALIKTALQPLIEGPADIATLGVEISDIQEKTNPNVVKIVGSPLAESNKLRALYFTRATAPYGDGPLYHHIGLYAYRREALEKFVALGQSVLEIREKLEQLRALEAGMRIDVEVVQSFPLGVDTPEDLEKARQVLSR
jgi:3-deoxy-manno-octulosonate cytidylyltransferase (CMP-KDO synthetase)